VDVFVDVGVLTANGALSTNFLAYGLAIFFSFQTRIPFYTQICVIVAGEIMIRNDLLFILYLDFFAFSCYVNKKKLIFRFG